MPAHPGLTAIFMLFLPDPSFVGSAFIQESLPKGNTEGDDDKIYFFFSEAGKEFDFFDNTIVSRIARVCKVSDALGQIVHLKEWLFFFFFFSFSTTLQQLPTGTHLHHYGNLTCHCALCVCVSAFVLYAPSQTCVSSSVRRQYEK